MRFAHHCGFRSVMIFTHNSDRKTPQGQACGSRKKMRKPHIWYVCATIALCLTRQDGSVQSAQQENLFLVRWFSDAERQCRFSRGVATDIRCMLQ
ncbi:DUF2913 family protein [Salmonella enterica subsp. enterica serovar Eastbourne]|nr:DUF2913 family protein [Salmonella enterica]EAR4614573.1 DUF2913 family protein [Salmonella enterica]EAR7815308.1 DUF2913 family protein [Salmonella enterica]ECU0035111.1 DUF2913 family protein [Salmonella enterica subsp. enterica serovar Eastbourne]EDT5697330.1 DUF2913 family protein [Salmonella enterica subsp. enterica serovar Eastbourne]